jgi:aspartate-semialdehyde dehydrogenase
MRRRRVGHPEHHGATVNAIAATLRIAVVGATSLIGEAVIDEIGSRKIEYAELHALEDARDIGAQTGAADRKIEVGAIDAFDFSRVDLVFFCSRAAVAERYAEAAARHAWVIDSSSAFRGRSEVPLVAVDVNAGVLARQSMRGLIALPGSASVALATALAPLHAAAGLERVEVATYHAVSGRGRAAMEALAAETVALLSGKKAAGRSFGRQIAFNVIPLVDDLGADGMSREEARMIAETRRVLGLPDLQINITAVRVPVFFGHGLAVHVRLERELSAAAAAAMLHSSNGLSVIEPDSAAQVPTPAVLASAPDQVYVGRIRTDPSRDRSLNFWVMADNVRKCAAHNAVSAAQILVNGSQ